MDLFYGFVIKYRRPLNTILLLLLLLASFVLLRDILEARLKVRQAPAELRVSRHNAAQRRFDDYAPVVNNNPFGIPGQELRLLSVVRSAVVQGPAQPENLALWGVVAGPRGLSCAIVADSSGRQEVFRIGQPVFGGGVLERVGKDEAVIRTTGGGSLKLKLVDMWLNKSAPSPEGTSPVFISRLQEKEFVVDRQALLNALDNPKGLMTDARLLPHTVEGRQGGFVLKEVKPGGIYQCLGLRNDDVLLRINDFDISQPEQILQAMNALRGLDRVTLDVVRANERITLTYQIG